MQNPLLSLLNEYIIKLTKSIYSSTEYEKDVSVKDSKFSYIKTIIKNSFSNIDHSVLTRSIESIAIALAGPIGNSDDIQSIYNFTTKLSSDQDPNLEILIHEKKKEGLQKVTYRYLIKNTYCAIRAYMIYGSNISQVMILWCKNLEIQDKNKGKVMEIIQFDGVKK